MTSTLPTLVLLALTAGPALADDKPVYRLDFELTTTEPGHAPTTTSFSLNLAEDRHGEATIGDNIALPSGTGAATMRENIGLRVNAQFVTRGTAILIDVETELTERAAGTSLHRMATKGAALATPGKKALVSAIDHDKAHTELTVTPTRL